MTEQSRRLVTTKVGAEYLCVSRNTMYRWIADGVVPSYRLGPRGIRVDLNELDAVLIRSNGDAA